MSGCRTLAAVLLFAVAQELAVQAEMLAAIANGLRVLSRHPDTSSAEELLRVSNDLISSLAARRGVSRQAVVDEAVEGTDIVIKRRSAQGAE